MNAVVTTALPYEKWFGLCDTVTPSRLHVGDTTKVSRIFTVAGGAWLLHSIMYGVLENCEIMGWRVAFSDPPADDLRIKVDRKGTCAWVDKNTKIKISASFPTQTVPPTQAQAWFEDTLKGHWYHALRHKTETWGSIQGYTACLVEGVVSGDNWESNKKYVLLFYRSEQGGIRFVLSQSEFNPDGIVRAPTAGAVEQLSLF